MKHVVIAIVAAATLGAVSAPAFAQSYGYRGDDRQEERGYHGQWSEYDRNHQGNRRVDGHLTSGYVDGLFWKLDNAVNEGRIAPGRAQQLKRELREVQELGYPVETGRATRWERQQLAQTVAKIDQALRERGRYGSNGYRR